VENRKNSPTNNSSNPLKRWLTALLVILLLLLITPLVLAATVLLLPASALESHVRTLTRGTVQLVMASGSVRSGLGELWVRDEARREWQPWMPLSWDVGVFWQKRGFISWPLIVLESTFGVISVNHLQVTFSSSGVKFPPGLLLIHFNHPLANAPWHGEMSLFSQGIVCEWEKWTVRFPRCDGQAMLNWQGMETSILPLQEFGNYVVTLKATSQGDSWLRADILTESGSVLISGQVEAGSRALAYRLKVSAEKPMIEGLASIIGLSPRKSQDGRELELRGSVERIDF
jgi:hypothetical protein